MARTTGRSVNNHTNIGGVEFVYGAGEIASGLRLMPKRVAKRHLLNSMRAGGRVIRDSAREKSPERTGALRSKITIKSPRARPGTVLVTVGVARGYASQKYARRLQRLKGSGRPTSKPKVVKPTRILPARYAHLYEFGSKNQPARPFFRPAIDENRDKVVQVIVSGLRKAIAEEAAQIRRGARAA